jgi:hypothetical protein
LVTHESLIAATPRRVYQNTHAYHINSISVNSDGETFLSADDLRINLWNLGIADQSFSTCVVRSDFSDRFDSFVFGFLVQILWISNQPAWRS